MKTPDFVKNYGQYLAFLLSIGLSTTPLIIGISGSDDWSSSRTTTASAPSTTPPKLGGVAPADDLTPWGRQWLHPGEAEARGIRKRVYYPVEANRPAGMPSSRQGWSLVVEPGEEYSDIRILWDSGWGEEIEDGVYRMIDPDGAVVVERKSSMDDRKRMKKLSGDNI